MRVEKILLAFVALAVVGALASAYTDSSLEVLVHVNDDGTAHVTEKATIFMDTQSEQEAFDYNTLAGASISDWTRFSKNVKYHVNGPVTSPKITGRRIGTSTGMILLDYDVATPIFSAEQTGSRMKAFSLVNGALGFELSKAGETILPQGTILSVELPLDAQIVSVSPAVSSSEKNVVSWSAAHGYVVGTWKLVFQREKALSSEVNAFFLQLYDQAISLIPPIILLAIAALVAYKFTRKK